MSAPWRCQCGHANEPEFTICLVCGKKKGSGLVTQSIKSPPIKTTVQDTQPKGMGKQDEQSITSKSGAPDTKWNARKQQIGAANLGRISWKTPLKKSSGTDTVSGELAPADVFRLVDAIQKGNEDAVRSSMEKLIEYRPRQAFDLLLKIASGLTNAKDERRIVAIQALGEIGDKAVAQELIKIKNKTSSDAEKIQIIAALGSIGDPVAVPSLIADQSLGDIVYKSVALYTLARIGDPSVLARLVMDVDTDSFADDLSEGMPPAVGGGFIGSTLKVINMVSQSNLNKRTTIRMMPLVADQDIPLEMIIQAPAEIRKAWMLKLRMWVIANICHSNNAFVQLVTAWQRANSWKKKLLIAISGIVCDEPHKDHWIKSVVEICQRGDKIERAIAYSALVRLGELNLAMAGLRDSDQSVAASTAASAIGLVAEPLYSSAITMASSSSADFRFGLVPGILTAAILFEETRAIPLAKALLADRDEDIREFANQYKDFVMENKKSFLEDLKSEQRSQAEPIIQPKSKPNWSKFGS
jgi:HEAT repeat protein